MNRNQRGGLKVFGLMLAAFLLVPMPRSAWAAGSSSVSLPQAESFAGDYFNAASNVDITGSVAGDLMVAGATLDLSGVVLGDVLSAGVMVRIGGKVDGSVRAAGGSLVVSGEVRKNLTAAGGSIKLDNDSRILGNAYLAAETVLLRGAHSGNIAVAARAAEISGTIAGSVTVHADRVSVLDSAEIAGDLIYYSERAAEISSSARIAGKIIHKPAYWGAFKKTLAGQAAGSFIADLWRLLALLLIALIAWRLAPAKLQKLLSEINEGFWEKLLWGLLGMVAIPIAAAILALTLVGLPLAFIALALYITSLFLAAVYAFLAFGKWLGGLLHLVEKQPENFPWSTFLLGGVALSVIAYLPAMGSAAVFLVWLWALGTLYQNLGKL